MLGAVAIFWAVSSAVDGWDGMVEKLEDQDVEHLAHISGYSGGSDDASPYPTGVGAFIVVMGWTIIGSGYWTVNHTQTMRLMGARSLWDMKMAAVAGVLLSLPIMIVCACLGIFGRSMPEFQHLTKDTADQLYPLLIEQYLGVGLKGLVVAGVVAAAVSTFDSMGSALSAIFTRDIYARLIVRNATDRHYVLVGRWATIAVLLIGFAYIPFIMLQSNMLDAFTTLIPVFVTPLFTMYLVGVFTRAPRRSGMFGLVAGSLFGIFALYCREAPKLGVDVSVVPAWLTDRWAALGWSLFITLTTIAYMTLFLGTEKKDKVLKFKQRGWLKRSSEQLPKLKEHPFKKAVPLWLNPGLYAIIMAAISVYVVFFAYW